MLSDQRGRKFVDVSFPAATDYYQQKTTAGNPFGSIAVLEGQSTLAFFYLWRCEYILTKETCRFCFQVRADMAGFPLPSPTDEEVAQVIGWAVERAGVKEVQLTAGTKFKTADECARYARLIRTIDAKVGLDRIPGEVYCYATAPKDPVDIDQIFHAGASRIGHDLHVWDRTLHARHAPGHARYIGRDGQLATLKHIAETFGPNRAFTAFVVGLEPLESLLEGAEYMARMGVTPAFSIWMPPEGSLVGDQTPPDLDFYRQARAGFARLYQQYGLNPPGAEAGSHVSLCRDIYRHDVLGQTA